MFAVASPQPASNSTPICYDTMRHTFQGDGDALFIQRVVDFLLTHGPQALPEHESANPVSSLVVDQALRTVSSSSFKGGREP